MSPTHSSEYDLVPTEPELVRADRSFSIRRVLLLVLVLFLVALAQGVPPDFYDIRAFERALPQHKLSDPDLDDARFFRFPTISGATV